MHRILIPLLLLTLALPGCWWDRNRRDPNFGYSVRQARQAQIIHPSNGDTTPVTGLDGQAAAKSMETYRDSFGEQKDIDAEKLVLEEKK